MVGHPSDTPFHWRSTGVVTWSAGVYPRALAVALVASALLGLATRLVDMPAWLGMSVVPAVFTGVVACLGVALMRLEASRGR